MPAARLATMAPVPKERITEVVVDSWPSQRSQQNGIISRGEDVISMMRTCQLSQPSELDIIASSAGDSESQWDDGMVATFW